MINILTTPSIRTRQNRQEKLATLPEILAMYAREEDFSLPALRAHQQHPWHAFICQMAAMAMDAAQITAMPTDAATWQRIITGITPAEARPTAWDLVVEDITKPAFMQPPSGTGKNAADYRIVHHTPDDIDILVTTSHHRMKRETALESCTDDWLVALITMQTAAGYDAPRTYGIYRMNKGFGNRPCVALTPAQEPHRAVARDVQALLETKSKPPELFPDGELIRLLWILPWDGAPSEALPMNTLHPLCIEACRRIRINADSGGKITARRATSAKRRVLDNDEKGFASDPWCPMDLQRKVAYTPAGPGTTTRRLLEIITDTKKWAKPRLLQPTSHELNGETPEMAIITRNLSKDQVKTVRYNEAIRPVGKHTLQRLLTSPPDPDAVNVATARMEAVNSARTALRQALQMAQYPAGAQPQQYRNENSRKLAEPWLQELEDRVYADFLEDLEQELAAAPDQQPEVRQQWQETKLRNTVRQVFDTARQRLIPPGRARAPAHLKARQTLEKQISRE